MTFAKRRPRYWSAANHSWIGPRRRLATEVIRRVRAAGNRVPGTEVLGLVGTGNNGGDVLFALARLARRGMSAYAISAGTVAFGRARRGRARRVRFADAGDLRGLAEATDVWLDGLVGIGARGPRRDAALEIVAELEEVQAGAVWNRL